MTGDRDARSPLPRASRWHPRVGLISISLLGLVSATLLTAIALIFGTVEAGRVERAQVASTSRVIEALGAIGRSAINAETGQRGYLITLDRSYLAPYEVGRERYRLALRELHRRLPDTAAPRQQALIARVEQLADAKFAEMARSVELLERGDIVGAQQAVLTDEGRELMDRLRATLAELEAFERASLAAAVAESIALERRIVPLLAGLVAIIVAALCLGVWQIARAARAEAAAAQVTALAEARDRADLLARELNHRVKNIFAVILAIVRMSGKDTPAAKPALERITQRIRALLTAHEVTQGSPTHSTIELRSLIEAVIAPYRSRDERCAVVGEPTPLPAATAMPLGLVLHELATNAVKYGAWSGPGGTVEVRWSQADGSLTIEWAEHGEPLPPTSPREGFGSLLMQGTARQLQGTIVRTFRPDGVDVRFEFPMIRMEQAPPQGSDA